MKRNFQQSHDEYIEIDSKSQLNPLQINKALQNKKQNIVNFFNQLSKNHKLPVDFSQQYQEMPNYIAEQIIDYDTLMELVENTIRKMKNNKKLKKNWNKQDLTILLFIIQKYNLKNSKKTENYNETDWQNIAELVPGKNHLQCMFKWLSLKKNNLNEYPWTQEEQIRLLKLVKQKGTNKWLQVSQELYLQNKNFKTFRSPKQCRQHWTCYMDPKLKKGPWRQEEDLQLLKNFVKIGKKWSQISKLLNGRTENAVKNRFNLIMDKQIKIPGKPTLSNVQYAKELIMNIQVSLPLIPSRLLQQQFYHQNQRYNPFINPFHKNLFNEPKIEDAQIQYVKQEKRQSQQNVIIANHNQSNFQKESDEINNGIKVIKFKKMSLTDLMKIQGIFPATYNKQTMEIVCREIKSKNHNIYQSEVKQLNNIMEAKSDIGYQQMQNISDQQFRN